MFRNTYQNGFLSILYSVGSQPLAIWHKEVKNGHIRRVTDEDVRGVVIELMGTNVATTFIRAPVQHNQTLAIKLPFLVMILKYLNKYFTFEIQILDDKNMHRRFRVSNYQSTTKIQTFCTMMPLGLTPGWNQIQFNVADFTKRAYGTNYIETERVQIHANIRLRRIYFSDRLYTEDEIPQEYKLFMPINGSGGNGKKSKQSHGNHDSNQQKLSTSPILEEEDMEEDLKGMLEEETKRHRYDRSFNYEDSYNEDFLSDNNTPRIVVSKEATTSVGTNSDKDSHNAKQFDRNSDNKSKKHFDETSERFSAAIGESSVKSYVSSRFESNSEYLGERFK